MPNTFLLCLICYNGYTLSIIQICYELGITLSIILICYELGLTMNYGDEDG
jgi:hypothetical protein